MTKLCSVCGTENREDAKFCRACGTAFAGQAARTPTDGSDASPKVCSECGFQNKPGLRYCANCGMGLAAAAPPAVASGTSAAAAETTGGSGPPPISYPSFATVGPYPPAPGAEAPPDIPDADAALAARRLEREEGVSTTMPFGSAPPPPSRAPLVIGGVLGALVVAGALAWIYMRDSDSSPPMIGTTTAPVAPPLPAAAVAAPNVVEATPSAAPATVAPGASAVDAPPVAAPAATADALGTPPAAAQPLPKIGDPVPPESAAEIDARRLAAEKRRERAARDKAEREAKTVAEQRDQAAAAAQRAEQEAARRRTDEAQRARAAAAVPPTAAPVAAQPRGVREICAGRGTISEAVCQSRECGRAEHASESICRQLREQDERRRNMLP